MLSLTCQRVFLVGARQASLTWSKLIAPSGTMSSAAGAVTRIGSVLKQVPHLTLGTREGVHIPQSIKGPSSCLLPSWFLPTLRDKNVRG